MTSEVPDLQTQYAHIVHTAGILAGEARVEGHRVRVRDIVAARDLGGMSPEEIAATVYPSLSLGEIYSALAYYEDHREEIDKASVDESAVLDAFSRQHPGLVRDLRPKKD